MVLCSWRGKNPCHWSSCRPDNSIALLVVVNQCMLITVVRSVAWGAGGKTARLYLVAKCAKLSSALGSSAAIKLRAQVQAGKALDTAQHLKMRVLFLVGVACACTVTACYSVA